MAQATLQPLSLLLVEDSEEDALLVLRELKKTGYQVTHQRVETAGDMREALRTGSFDLVISDYCLPTFSGPEALAVLKESGVDLPFIIVSGTIGEETAVAAMRAGANDFLVKSKYSRLGPAIARELRDAGERRARRQAEQKLLTNERRFRSLIENASDIITVLDLEGRILYVSPAVQRVLGYTPEEILDRNLFQLVHPVDVELQKAIFQLADEMGPPTPVEVRIRHKKGHYRLLEAIGKNLMQDPVVGGLVVNCRDVTERRQAEAQLREALDQLQKTQEHIVQQERLRALGEMASGVAHDFNNALSSILGFTEAMLMYPEVVEDKEQTLEFIQMINTAAKDGANIVQRLSQFYRQREANETLAPVDLNKMLEGTASLTAPRWKAQAQAKGIAIEIDLDLDPGIPLIPMAEAELRQAFTNLIFNAVDAMPAGGVITLRTRLKNDFAEVEVQDQGTGMSEETIRRCLEPFFTTKGEKGTGLGLAMVYGVIQRHNGTIGIESELGRGTTFRIHLPLVQPEQTQQQETSQTAVDRGLKVLVVEPEPMVRKVLTDYLQGDGHSVVSAEDGKEGLKLLGQEATFEVVITDKALPTLSGIQLAGAIHEAWPQLPVVLLTGFGDGAEQEQMPAGVRRVLTKPFTLAEFRRALAEAVTL